MATCLKRTSKLFNISLTRSSVDVTLQDLICAVCRSILIEPVTLPCTHNLCLKCLKGTFEHNSLNCPLCRIRVGSWLRTATKTETLVNNGLWQLIQTRFSKEVESKYNGDDRIAELDADFNVANRMLSTAGEIRQEYQVQLRMAKKEIQCRRKAEEIASQALIRKIREEEEQKKFVQLTQDQLLAKSLAKKQMVEKEKEVCEYKDSSNGACHLSKFNVGTMTETESNRIEPHGSKHEKRCPRYENNLASKGASCVEGSSAVCRKGYAPSVENVTKVSSNLCGAAGQFFCEKSIPVYASSVPQVTKSRATSKIAASCFPNCPVRSKASASQIYGTRSKEELRIPNCDVVASSKRKTLGVEVCVSVGDDEERMGSAESSGSHDSINQEIHHFKPIKAVPRTSLKVSTDGKQIDPKLIRAVPVLKKISNVVPKPPSQDHFKRIIGCSWSAFRGFRPRENHGKVVSETIAGNEGSKKEYEVKKADRSWKSHVRNGMVCKSKRQRSLCNKKGLKTVTNLRRLEASDSICSSRSGKSKSPCEQDREENGGLTVENIAERIKKRKINKDNAGSDSRNHGETIERRSARRRSARRRSRREDVKRRTAEADYAVDVEKGSGGGKFVGTTTLPKDAGDPDERNSHASNCDFRKIDRKVKRSSRGTDQESPALYGGVEADGRDSSEPCGDLQERVSGNVNATGATGVSSDDEIVKEQERMERLVIQEKEDFELAQRLQAKFDEMERISGRTRRSRRVVESETFELDLYKIDIGRSAQKTTSSHTAKTSATNHIVNTESKKCSKHRKRVK